MSDTTLEKIIVLDYGSQYNQLIARRIREIGVFSELMSHKVTAKEIREINPIGIILSGGPNSVYDEGSFDIYSRVYLLRNAIVELQARRYGRSSRRTRIRCCPTSTYWRISIVCRNSRSSRCFDEPR